MTDDTDAPDDETVAPDDTVARFPGAWKGTGAPPEQSEQTEQPTGEVVAFPATPEAENAANDREEMLGELEQIRQLVEKGELRALSVIGLAAEGCLDVSWNSTGAYDAPAHMAGAMSMHAFAFQLQAFQDMELETMDD